MSLQPFLFLPSAIQARVLSFLPPEDLRALSKGVAYMDGVGEDKVVYHQWLEETVPPLIEHLLFASTRYRPDPAELVRKGILKGIGVIRAVDRSSYFSSAEAVRLSRLHASIHLQTLHQLLNRHLSPSSPRPRPSLAQLHALGLIHSSGVISSLPSSSSTLSATPPIPHSKGTPTSGSGIGMGGSGRAARARREGASHAIQAKAWELERKRRWEGLKRGLEGRGLGRTLGEVMFGGPAGRVVAVGVNASAGSLVVEEGGVGWVRGKNLWDDGQERVVLALCPSIRPTRRFWEEVASREASPSPGPGQRKSTVVGVGKVGMGSGLGRVAV